MKPWRLGMHVVCVDTNWHRTLHPGEEFPSKGDVLVISEIDWHDRQAEHSKCGLNFEGVRYPAGAFFCDCHFRPATEPPTERATRGAPSPARSRELEAV